MTWKKKHTPQIKIFTSSDITKLEKDANEWFNELNSDISIKKTHFIIDKDKYIIFVSFVELDMYLKD